MDLIVIEAPGKIRRMHEIFESLGLKVDVIATLGHLLDNPRQFSQPAINIENGRFIEPLRTPVRPDVMRRLDLALSSCTGRVLVATDIDREGDVIAHDIATRHRELNCKAPIWRLRLSALSSASLTTALEMLSPIVEADATPGTARRITDRLITEQCSDMGKFLPVGRVQTAALELIERGISQTVVTLPLPAEQGIPFSASISIPSGVTPADLIKQLSSQCVRGTQIITEVMTPPPTGDAALLAVSTQLKIGITESARLLQELYEQGHISYHRSLGTGYSAETRERLSRFAIGRGILAFKAENLALQSALDGHEAVSVLQPELIDLSKPIALQRSKQEAALAVIGRMNIESGILVQREYADTSRLNIPPQCHVTASRQRSPILPWAQSPSAQHSVSTLAPDQALFKALVANKIGTPSTRPLIVDKLTSDSPYLIHSGKLLLSEKGLKVLEQAPKPLRDLLTSEQLERQFSNKDESVESLVIEALTLVMHGDNDKLNAIIMELEERMELDAPRMRLR